MIRLNCDYLEGCHPAILARLAETNLEQTPGYGCDDYCKEAAEQIRAVFACPSAAVHFLVGGTQTNMTVIAAALRPWEGVLCAESGHINVHETGAVEATGHKCLALPAEAGKIIAEQVSAAVKAQGNDEHTVRPGMVYISQSTEVGTVYSLAELKALYAVCRSAGLLLFVDGARLGYGLTAEGADVRPEDLSRCCDVFTVGGTKQGALFGEAVVITNSRLKQNFRYAIKQRGGMLAKGRLLGLQFSTLMTDRLYFSLAQKANAQAARIRRALKEKNIPLLVDSPSNQLFPIFTNAQAADLAQSFVLEDQGRLDADHLCRRVCTSWATPDAYVEAFVSAISRL